MKTTLLSACLLLCSWLAAAAAGAASPPQEGGEASFEALFARAEALCAEGSWARALELYERAAERGPSEEQARWLRLRTADARWRSAAATEGADTTEVDRARKALEEIAASAPRPEDRDEVWALAQESLGDFWWTRQQTRNFGVAWQAYHEALWFWARSSDLERARERYLTIVDHAARPSWFPRDAVYGSWRNRIPREVLENVLEIAPDDAWRARAHFMLGVSYAQEGRSPRGRLALEELDLVLAFGTEGPAGEWADDALYQGALHLENAGRPVRGEDGEETWKPDYAGAVARYRRLLETFRPGQSPYRREATERVRQITQPTLSLAVERLFLPGSEVPYRLGWRNLERVDLSLHPLDLTRDLSIDREGNRRWSWVEDVDLSLREPALRWTHETEDVGEHVPGSTNLWLAEKPALGVYVLRATGGGQEARALVLVSDVGLSVKASGDELLAWLTDVRTGEPRGEARLRLWRRVHDGRDWRTAEVEGTTAADGTALFRIEGARNVEYFLAAQSGDSQAFVAGNGWWRHPGQDTWRVYATTDRPAYRPGDPVQWKATVRASGPEGYRTPAGERLAWEVRDPRGEVVAQGEGELNAFGSLWGTIETTEAMTLGEYQASFERVRERGAREGVGGATLFRLEEYKLPEYEVSVETAGAEEGQRKVFVLGDEVSFDVTGTYYFGGPVAGAEVEVFVHMRPFWRVFPRGREYPWLFEESDHARQWWGGPGQQILHETLRTDAEGKARLSFETPVGGGQDLEYTIEARMVDASRREVVGRDTVRVTRTEYQVDLSVEHALHRPGDAVEIAVRAADANDEPVSVEGRLRVQRARWIEVWIDPSGKKVTGRSLEELRRDGLLPPPGTGGWHCTFAGYEQETVAETTLTTDAEGRAAWTPRLEREGHYVVSWRSRDGRGNPIEAGTRVFVASEATVDLGVDSDGIELVLDKESFVEGEEAAFVLLAEGSGRWVLLTAEAEGLLHHEVVKLEGTAKLMRLPIQERHVPNFWLSATTVFGGSTHRDAKQVVVPPTKHFLDVEASFAAEAFEPGSAGELRVVVRDHRGEPVATELSLGVWDAALAYVQGDYAGDPRRFFYGERRNLTVQTASSFDRGAFVLQEKQERREEEVGRYRGPGDTVPPEKEGFSRGARADGELQALGYASEQADMAAPAAKSVLVDQAGRQGAPGPGGGGPEPVVRVRSDFRETALWLPDVATGADGTASVSVPFPDSTTRWNATIRAATTGADFGQGEASARTRLPIIARLQAPRFFRVGDEVVVSANVNNGTDAAVEARVSLSIEGLAVLGRLLDGELADPSLPISVAIPAGDQARVDWLVRVEEPGSAVLELAALAGEHGDAVRRELPVLPHGIEVLEARAGKLPAGEGTGELAITLPLPARAPGSTRFEVQLAPSMAVTMLDALPYLVDYPYGCTEQTLSRFLPSAIVAKALRDLGLSAEDAMERVFGGVEGEWAAKTHPKGAKSLDLLDEMTAQGLARLYELQHSDGGWSWWKDGESDPYMTAYVVWGLSLGRDAGLEVRQGVLESGASWLALHLVEQEQRPDMAAWLLHALGAFGRPIPHAEADLFVAKAFDRLWGQRDRLNAYSRALFTLAAAGLDRMDEARVLARNLANGVEIDRSPDTSIVTGGGDSRPYVLATAHWGETRGWWRWSDGAVESTAFALRALLAVDPENELVEPAMNWLVKNRRGAQWSNTRDTAIAVLALADWLRLSGERAGEGSFELLVNGARVAELAVSPETLLRAPSVVRVEDEHLRDGENRVTIRRTAGTTALYFAVEARFFSREEPIPARGNEVFVRRDYYKLVGRPTLLAGTLFERVPLEDGETVESGTRVEVVLTVEGKNDLEYLVFEDHKPAGFEAVGVRSGEPCFARELRRDAAEARFTGDPDAARDERRGRDREGLRPPDGGPSDGLTGRSLRAHQELRDTRVALFLDRLPQGFWELRYDLRAEVPGRFHALPLEVHAMYVPEIRANGEELRVEVLERAE